MLKFIKLKFNLLCMKMDMNRTNARDKLCEKDVIPENPAFLCAYHWLVESDKMFLKTPTIPQIVTMVRSMNKRSLYLSIEICIFLYSNMNIIGITKYLIFIIEFMKL